MNRIFYIVSLIFCVLNYTMAQQAKYVILISIDGLRPEFYKESSWGTPTLHQLKDGGIYADGVRSVFPSVTYPSHTTIITGALPAKHGIYYNEPFEPGGQTGRYYWEENLIKVPTLWDAIHKAGLTSSAVSWPVSDGGPIDYNIPEIWSLDKTVDRMTPIKEHTTPKGFFEEIEKNATGKLCSEDFNSDNLRMDNNIARIAAYLITTYKPNFVAVHLVCVDHYQHLEGRNGTGVKKAVICADNAVEQIMEAIKNAGIKDSTAIIVTGDHGFADFHTALAPNVWLTGNGLITKVNGKTKWKAIFHTAGASAFLHLQNPSDKSTLKTVRTILEQLPDSTKKLFRIIGRDELDKTGADPNAVLALTPVQGVTMSSATEGNDTRSAHGGTHGHFPDFKEMQTGFIAYGPAFEQGKVIPIMGLQDIAPIVAQLLQLDFKAPDGIVYPGILRAYKAKN